MQLPEDMGQGTFPYPHIYIYKYIYWCAIARGQWTGDTSIYAVHVGRKIDVPLPGDRGQRTHPVLGQNAVKKYFS